MFRRTLSTFSEKKQIARVIEWKRNLGHGLAITPSGDQLFIHRSMILGEDGDRRGLLLHQMVMVATDGYVSTFYIKPTITKK